MLNAFIIIARAWRRINSNLVILDTYIIICILERAQCSLSSLILKAFSFTVIVCQFSFFLLHLVVVDLFAFALFSCLFAGFIAQRQQTKLTSLNNNCCASLHVSFLSPELQSLWTVSSSDQELWLAMGPGFTHKHSSFTLLSPFVTLIIWNFWCTAQKARS